MPLDSQEDTDATDLARTFVNGIGHKDISPTRHALLDLLSSPLALEKFVALTAGDCHGPYPFSFIIALAIAAHGNPWKFAPRTPNDIGGGSLQHILGIYHKLALDPSLNPNIPWLDSQLCLLAIQARNRMTPIESTERLYWNALCLIAQRVNYTPSSRFVDAMSLVQAALIERARRGDPPSNGFLHGAEVLSHMGLLPASVQLYLRGQYLAPRLEEHPYLYDDTHPSSMDIRTPLTSVYHLGLPTAPMAALSELARTRPGAANYLYRSYDLAMLLPPAERLTWLDDPRVATIAPILFALPLYAPSQFTAVSNDTWTTALASANSTVKPLLIPLLSAVRSLPPHGAALPCRAHSV